MYFIIILIVFFIAGLSVMGKIDSFINSIQNEDQNELNSQDKILVCGEGEIMNRVISNLDKLKLNYKVTTENSLLEEKYKYKFMLIASGNDLDNLMLCSLAKRMMKIEIIITVCNDINNKRIFNEYDAISFDPQYICSDQFPLILKEKISNE